MANSEGRDIHEIGIVMKVLIFAYIFPTQKTCWFILHCSFLIVSFFISCFYHGKINATFQMSRAKWKLLVYNEVKKTPLLL